MACDLPDACRSGATHRRALEELAAAVDAHELGLQTAAAVQQLWLAADRCGAAWWEAVGVMPERSLDVGVMPERSLDVGVEWPRENACRRI
jgi:hypothetical protein